MRNLLEPRAALKEIDHETALRELVFADDYIACLQKDVADLEKKLRRSDALVFFWATATVAVLFALAGVFIYCGVGGK